MSDIIEISYKFPKRERLKSRKDIGLLFKSKQSVFAFPIKIIYRIIDDSEKVGLFQAAFTVPKRNFKRAVDRNLLKRRIKESYRLQRNSFKNHCKSEGICIQMMLIYTGKKEHSYVQIEKAIIRALDKLEQALSKH